MLAIFDSEWQWIVILFIAFLLFGSRLPSAMRNLGRSVTEFKRGMHEMEDEMNKPPEAEAKKEESQPPKPA